MTVPDRPLRERLEGLAALLPPSRASGCRVGRSDDAREAHVLHQLAYEDGWIRSDLDWPAWKASEEARALRDDPAALERAAVLATDPDSLVTGDARSLRSIIGIDCATDPKNVGLARAWQEGDGWRIAETRACSKTERPETIVAQWIQEVPRVLLALDAPLGWPEGFGSRLASHRAGDVILVPPPRFFNRETDRFVKRVFGHKPLDVGADRIARTAHAALSFLAAVRSVTRSGIPLAWTPETAETPAAIEVYPAATLMAHGLPGRGFKGKDAGALRRPIQNMLTRRFGPPHPFDAESMDEHQLDAVLCVLAGVDFLHGEALPPEDEDLARREGWMWVKGVASASE